MLWALLSMAVILAVALTIVLVVAYPHRRTSGDRPSAGAALRRVRAALVPSGARGRLWLDGRRG